MTGILAEFLSIAMEENRAKRTWSSLTSRRKLHIHLRSLVLELEIDRNFGHLNGYLLVRLSQRIVSRSERVLFLSAWWIWRCVRCVYFESWMKTRAVFESSAGR